MPIVATITYSPAMAWTLRRGTLIQKGASYLPRSRYFLNFEVHQGGSYGIWGTYQHPDQNGTFNYGGTVHTEWTGATICMRVTSQYLNPYDLICEGDYVVAHVDYEYGNDGTFLFYLPNIVAIGTGIGHGTSGTIRLWDTVNGCTYYDSSFATRAAGGYTIRDYSDSIIFAATLVKNSNRIFADSFNIDETWFTERRRIYPANNIGFSDFVSYYSPNRQASFSGWHFTPSYKIFFDEIGDGTWATTNWNLRCKSYNSLSKSIRHWTGEFEVGKLKLDLINENNEIWGSLYGSSIAAECRGKQIMVRSILSYGFDEWQTQYTAEITETQSSEGIIALILQDRLYDLPSKKFIFDYQCYGSKSNIGEEWGVVTKVYGTQVMFNDKGGLTWIPIIQKGKSIWTTLLNTAIGFGLGMLKGVWVGAGVGVLGGLTSLPSGDRLVGGYYKVRDEDAVPEDLITNGGKLKFYYGSISGIATNLDHPLVKVKECSVLDGTFRFGLYATVSLDTVEGIQVGQYVYARRALQYQGNPNEILKALLCGSNINYPYSEGSLYEQVTHWGIVYGTAYSDFNSEWKSELSAYDLFDLNRTLIPSDDITPFSLIKEICEELQISFFIDEDNRFSVRTVKPRFIISSGNEATYAEGSQILSGFNFIRNSDDAISGIKIYYNFLGQGLGAYKDGYAGIYELPSSNHLSRINSWKEIECKWIYQDSDAQVIAYRALMNGERGIDRVDVPLTIVGIGNSLTDPIRITHRTGSLTNALFEIESYTKRFSDDSVDFQAISFKSGIGYGNGTWVGTTIPTAINSVSGFSINGLPSNGSSAIGSLLTALLTADDKMYPNNPYTTNYRGQYLCLGTGYGDNTEIIVFNEHYRGKKELDVPSYIPIFRGLFNTIPRKWGTATQITSIGAVATNIYGEYLPTFISSGSYIFATSYNIHGNLGTSFRVF